MGIFDHWYILVIVLTIVLIVWGPGKLPEIGGAMGRAIREFQKASAETRSALQRDANPSTQQSADEPSHEPMSQRSSQDRAADGRD